MLGCSLVAELLAASREGLSSKDSDRKTILKLIFKKQIVRV
jgi:hypothetical protein